MNKIRLWLSIGVLVVTVGVGLSCTFATTEADEIGIECNCIKVSPNRPDQSGLLCYRDGSLACCPGGCYDIAAVGGPEN